MARLTEGQTAEYWHEKAETYRRQLGGVNAALKRARQEAKDSFRHVYLVSWSFRYADIPGSEWVQAISRVFLDQGESFRYAVELMRALGADPSLFTEETPPAVQVFPLSDILSGAGRMGEVIRRWELAKENNPRLMCVEITRWPVG